MKLAFLGLGIMGSRMAHNCLAAGHTLTLWNRTADKARDLVARGATLAATPADAVAGAEVVVTMLARPEAVEEVAFGAGGFAERLTPGQLWVDSSTVDPAFAKTLGTRARRHGFRFVDAPVAGTKGPAAAGELLFLVGGDAADVALAGPLFDAMGKKRLHLGPVGSGAAMKVLVNGLLAQGMLAFAEAVHLGTALGLARAQVFDVLLGTPVTAPFLAGTRPKTEGDDDSVNFPLALMHKDLHLATLAAYQAGQPVPSLAAAKEVYAGAVAAGLGEQDFTGVFGHVAGAGPVLRPVPGS